MTEATIVNSCEKCGLPMIDAAMYDPDGEISLHGGRKEHKDGQLIKWFVCINPICEDGGKNNG